MNAHEMRAARERQMQADVRVHEVYESISRESDGSQASADSGDIPAPSETELQHYTRQLNNPGQIQAHGALLVVDERDLKREGLKIKAASGNCQAILGRSTGELLFGVKPQAENLHSLQGCRDAGHMEEAAQADDASRASTEKIAELSSAGSSASSNTDNGSRAHPNAMSLFDLFDEMQTIETALTLKNLDLANPVTVNIRKTAEGGIAMLPFRYPPQLSFIIPPLSCLSDGKRQLKGS